MWGISYEKYIFDITVRDNIDLRGKLEDKEILQIIDRVKLNELLEDLGGIDNKIDKVNKNVSGGEKARIAIPRVLAEGKQIIIADEILANLDGENSKNIESLLLSLDDKMLIHICHHHNEELKELYDGELVLC